MQKSDKKFLSIIIIIFSFFLFDNVFCRKKSLKKKQYNYALQDDFLPYRIQTVLCDLIVTNRFMEEIITSRTMERLEYIDQGGPGAYFGYEPHFDRRKHSLAVAALIQFFAGKLEEIITGLLHDASHTAFSHCGDLFHEKDMSSESSYQDDIHLQFLATHDVNAIIEKYGETTLQTFDPKNDEYKRLEQPLPDMCADRIAYNLQTALAYDLFTHDEVLFVIEHLHFENNQWFFDDVQTAKTFAQLPIIFLYRIWANPKNIALFYFFVAALKQAVSIGILSEEIMDNGTDQDVMKILKESEDETIKKLLICCSDINHHHIILQETDGEPTTIFTKSKCRAIDPLVQIYPGASLQRLSEIDPDFKEKFEKVREYCNNGVYIKLIY